MKWMQMELILKRCISSYALSYVNIWEKTTLHEYTTDKGFTFKN